MSFGLWFFINALSEYFSKILWVRFENYPLKPLEVENETMHYVFL